MFRSSGTNKLIADSTCLAGLTATQSQFLYLCNPRNRLCIWIVSALLSFFFSLLSAHSTSVHLCWPQGPAHISASVSDLTWQRRWCTVRATVTWFGRSPGYTVRRILAPSFPLDLNLLCLSDRLRPQPRRFPPAVHWLINGFITSPSPCVIVISPPPALYVYSAHISASAVTLNLWKKNKKKQAAEPGREQVCDVSALESSPPTGIVV